MLIFKLKLKIGPQLCMIVITNFYFEIIKFKGSKPHRNGNFKAQFETIAAE